MGRHGKQHPCVCVDCGARRELSKPEARRERWELWLGGSRCAACVVKREPHLAPLPAPFGPKYTEHVMVVCSECRREMESTQEYTDGWRPGIHWTKDPEAIQRTKDSLARRTRDPKAKVSPLPLCPGWNRAGNVSRIERRPRPELQVEERNAQPASGASGIADAGTVDSPDTNQP